MRLLQYLNENFAAIGKSAYSMKKTLTEIYVNPTKQDLLDLRKSIVNSYDEGLSPTTRPAEYKGNIGLRLIADPTEKKLFVFSSTNLTHNDAYRILKKEGYFKKSDLADCWQSFCRVSPQGNLVNQTGGRFEHYLLDPKAEGQYTRDDITGGVDWTWLRKYF